MSDPQPGEMPAEEHEDAGATPAPAAQPDGRDALIDKLRKFEREAAPQLKELARLKAAQAEAERAQQTEAERIKTDLEGEKIARGAVEQERDALRAELQRYRERDALTQLVEAPTVGEGDGAKPNPLYGVNVKALAKVIDPADYTVNEAGEVTNRRKVAERAAQEYGLLPAREEPTRPAHAPQRAAAGGALRTKSTAQRQIDQRYTTLPANVTKR